MPKKGQDKDEIDRQIKLIHTLAERLPWLVVIIVLFATILIILEVIVKKS